MAGFSADMDDIDDNDAGFAAQAKPKPSRKVQKVQKVQKAVLKRPATAASSQTPARRPPKAVPSQNAAAAILQMIAAWSLNMVIETCEHKHSGITVASACCGWCSELIALTRLGVRHTCCFACDICRKAKALSTRTYQHHKWFDNVMDESFLRAPTVDFFFSGFPCQSFSTAGLGKGIADLRGIVVFYVLHYIYRAKPKCFLLENVEGLLTNHKPILVLILEVIMEMKDAAGQRLWID